YSCLFFFFSSRRRHTRFSRDWSSDVCSSDLLFLDGPDNGVHFTGSAVDDARLDALHRIGADGRAGVLQAHPGKLGGARKQGFQGDADARANGAAQVLPVFGDAVKGGRGSQVDHDGGERVLGLGRCRVGDTVRADVPRGLVADGQARVQLVRDDQGLHAKIALGHPLPGRQHRRQDAGDGDGGYPVGVDPPVGEKLVQEDAVLVGGLLPVTLDPPGALEGIAVEQADGGVGISDVQGEEQRLSPLSSASGDRVCYFRIRRCKSSSSGCRKESPGAGRTLRPAGHGARRARVTTDGSQGGARGDEAGSQELPRPRAGSARGGAGQRAESGPAEKARIPAEVHHVLHALRRDGLGLHPSGRERAHHGSRRDRPLPGAQVVRGARRHQRPGRLLKDGSEPNAYTGQYYTVYLCSLVDEFRRGLDLLLDYVQRPYFTDENVAKEQGIIEQEIQMGLDNPQRAAYYNLIEGLFHRHPARIRVIGSVESIRQITKEMLYFCYDTFYHPSNMVVTVAGDVSFNEVLDIVTADMSQRSYTKRGPIVRPIPEEPDHVLEAVVENRMKVSRPYLLVGFKGRLDRREGESSRQHHRRLIAAELALHSVL